MKKENQKLTTLEEMQKAMKAIKEKQQNEFIDKIVEMINLLCEKANKKDYEPTQHEKEMFNHIYVVISNMNNWF